MSNVTRGAWKAILTLLVTALAVLTLAPSAPSDGPIEVESRPTAGSLVQESAQYDPPACRVISRELEADKIIASRNESLLPVAERAYENLLETSPKDPCAVAGLARLKLLQEELQAAKSDELPWPERLSKDWTSWYKASIDTLAPAFAFSGGLLLFLLVLSRLFTSVFVSTATGAPSSFHRITTWAVGILMLAAASLAPLVSASSTLSFSQKSPWWPVGLIISTGLCVALLQTSHASAVRSGWTRSAVCVGLVGSISATALYWLVKSDAAPAGTVPVMAMGTLAVLGVTLTAFSRGTVLAVQVDVQDDAGTVNGSAGRLATARLQTLGAYRPTGLRMPGPSDVTNLPEDALTTVPGGALATLFFNVLKVLRPAVPWHVVVTMPHEERHTLSITRNGKAVEEGSMVLTSLDIPGLTSTSSGSADEVAQEVPDGCVTDELLTASAAHVLQLLSLRHTELEEGMCGADTWQALALHAIAIRSSTPGARRTQLLTSAIDASPRYILPKVAYLNTLADNTPEKRLRYCKKIEDLWHEYREQLGGSTCNSDPLAAERGYEATQLRLLYNRALGWANVRTDESLSAALVNGAPAPAATHEAWQSAVIAALALNRRLKVADPDWPDAPSTRLGQDPILPLARRMRLTAAYVLHDLSHSAPEGNSRPIAQLKSEVSEYAKHMPLTRFPLPRTRHDAYAYACLLANRTEQDRTDALDWLEVSATMPSLSDWAREDPSLAPFWREGNQPRATPAQVQRFRTIVAGEAIENYLELEPFAAHKEELRAFGMLAVGDLTNATPSEIAEGVGVHRATASKWSEIAALYTFAVKPQWESSGNSLEMLKALLDAEVYSVEDLRSRMARPDEFYAELLSSAKGLSINITREATVCKWKTSLCDAGCNGQWVI